MSDIKRETSTNLQIKRKSLAQKYFLGLRPCEIWCLLRKRTQFNSTLIDCIQAGLDNPDDNYGLYATDADCYEVFRSLFWPVIMDSHQMDIRNFVFQHDFGDPNHIDDLPSELSDRIYSIHVRIHRSIQGYPMIPKLTRDQLLEIEERLRQTFEDLQGEYRSLKDINPTEFQEKSIRVPVNFLSSDKKKQVLCLLISS